MILNNRTAWATLVLAALIAGVVLHTAAQEEVTVVHAPVLNACKDEVTDALRAIPRSSPFVARYVSFDDTFPSHPAVAGFVVLESSEYARERLLRLAGGFTAQCRRLISDAFSKTTEQEAKRLFDFLGQVSAGTVSYFDAGVGGKVDPEQLYIVNEPEALRVYFGLKQ